MFKTWRFIRNKVGKPIQRMAQERIEDIAYNIDIEFGLTVTKVIETRNNIEEKLENIVDTIDNTLSSGRISEIKDKIRSIFQDIEEGDHIYVYGLCYTHHGLYIGNDEVIHYSKGFVTLDGIFEFSNGKDVYKMTEFDSPTRYPVDEIISRAHERLGECDYNLIFNNCDNFVRWCRCGD